MDASPLPPRHGRSRCLAVVLSLLLTACAGTGPAGAPPAELPPLDAVIPGGYPPYPDNRLQQYVQKVGDRLLRANDTSGARLRFTVTDNPGFAAVVGRSGNVYISRGLLALLQSEAELAAVLAHEIAHHLSGHSRKTETEALTTLSRSEQLASRIGGRDSREMTRTFTRAMVKGRVREQEIEADRLSIGYLVRAGYEPQAAIDALQLLAQLAGPDEPPPSSSSLDDDGYIPPIFRDHPEPNLRIAALTQEVRTRRNLLAPGEGGRDSYLKAIDGLVYDGDGRDYVRRGQNLYFPLAGLMLRLKDQWRLISHTPGKLTFRSIDQRFRLTISHEKQMSVHNPRNLIDLLHRQDQTQPPRPLRVGAYSGYRHAGKVQLSGQQLRSDAVVISNQQVLLRLFVFSELSTPAPELTKKADDLIASLREMNAADRTAALPLRIRIHLAGKNVTFQQMVRTSPLTIAPEFQLRLINRQLPFGEPKTGEAVKVIQ